MRARGQGYRQDLGKLSERAKPEPDDPSPEIDPPDAEQDAAPEADTHQLPLL